MAAGSDVKLYALAHGDGATGVYETCLEFSSEDFPDYDEIHGVSAVADAVGSVAVSPSGRCYYASLGAVYEAGSGLLSRLGSEPGQVCVKDGSVYAACGNGMFRIDAETGQSE